MGKKLSLRKNKEYGKKYKMLVMVCIGIVISLIIANITKKFFSSFIFEIKDTINALKVGVGNGFPCEIEGNKVSSGNISMVNGNIVIVSDKFFESFNSSGRKISCRPHGFSNPIMKSCGNRAILYDAGGKGYSLESCSENIFKGTSEYPIICSDVARNGVYGFITDSSTYLSQMSILNKEKTEKYKYNFADFYVCDMSLRPDGAGAVVCGNSSLNGEMNSSVYVFNFSEKEPLITYEFPDLMLVSVHYLSNRYLVAIGDKSIIFIDIKKKEKKEIGYSSKTLKCMDIDKNLGLLCHFSSECEDEKNKLVFFDKSGETKFEFNIPVPIEKCLRYGNKILGIRDKNVLIYDISGNLKNKIDMENLPVGILKISSSTVGVLENKVLKKVNIF